MLCWLDFVSCCKRSAIIINVFFRSVKRNVLFVRFDLIYQKFALTVEANKLCLFPYFVGCLFSLFVSLSCTFLSFIFRTPSIRLLDNPAFHFTCR